jgi:transposase-like protein
MASGPPPGDIDLSKLVSRFRSEDKCRAYLEQLRWPDGVRCPRCDASKGISRIANRGQFDCDSCGYQFSVRAGTIFHRSHLPLWKWFLAVYVMAESQTGVSANRLKRILGVSYKTAWYLSHRIRSAMKDEAPELLRDVILNRQDLHRFIEGREATVGSVVGHLAHPATGAGHRDSVDSVWSLLKRSVSGSYHHLSPKHLSSYLDEMAFRHNNRDNPYLFRDTLLRLLGAESLPYRELVARV